MYVLLTDIWLYKKASISYDIVLTYDSLGLAKKNDSLGKYDTLQVDKRKHL